VSALMSRYGRFARLTLGGKTSLPRLNAGPQSRGTTYDAFQAGHLDFGRIQDDFYVHGAALTHRPLTS
jgi:hypothetical protein